nr:hypothetical protein [Tanacetum cinerariifolium]
MGTLVFVPRTPLPLEREIKGSILTPYKGRRSFSTYGRTGSSLSTFGRGRAVYISTSPIHCERRVGNWWCSKDSDEVKMEKKIKNHQLLLFFDENTLVIMGTIVFVPRTPLPLERERSMVRSSPPTKAGGPFLPMVEPKATSLPLKDKEDQKQLQQPHSYQALALSQVFPNNLYGGHVHMGEIILMKTIRTRKPRATLFGSVLDPFKAYEWDEEEVSSDDNEMIEVKVLMALVEDNDAVSKEGARNSEWIKISIRKCISEQIPTQKKRIIGVDQLTEDPFSSGQKDPVFINSSANDTKVSIPGVERPWLSEAEGFILPNHDTIRILPPESQTNTTEPLVVVTDSSATDYDSADESSVCSTPLPPLEKLGGAEPASGPKAIKSILKSKSTFKTEA